ncbi:MAG: DNA mismatch repair protein MutS [Dinghuibacter sp.]|nr:DNA mismatch repair protein MutS [Dinghuibacter sp.]
MAKSSADTPLMQQHRAIKQKYPDAILLFRVGDFYETFGNDAVIASGVLGITLTKRNNGAAASSELAGFPHHALDTYLHKLVKAGHRVAICDQLEDPKQAKGIVKRGVTEMVTPGIAIGEKLLEHGANNFLAAVFAEQEHCGVAFLDISTGEFFVAQGNTEYTDRLFQTFRPAEIIFQRNYQKTFKEVFGPRYNTYALDSWIFDLPYTTELLLKHFQTVSLSGFGIDHLPMAVIAAGAVLHYLRDTEHPNLQQITGIRRLDRDDYLWMDQFTIRNLEIVHSPGDQRYSLLQTLDNTQSPMGARLLKRWLTMPLTGLEQINERLSLTEFLVKETDLRNKLVEHIRSCGDMERLAGRIPMRKIGPRDVLLLARGLEHAEQVKTLGAGSGSELLVKLCTQIDPCTEMARKIAGMLVEQPPPTAQKGGIFRKGIHAELDELRAIAGGGKDYLVQMQQKEAEATGISSLKIGFNNVFGYYLEVTHAHKNKVPETWIRKQTLTNAERYITPELKHYEEQITGAEDKILNIETTLFENLLQELQQYIAPVQINAQVFATLDCLSCFAGNALQFQYKKPEVHMGLDLELKASRHPVIERYLPPGEQYIANDIYLAPESQQIIILTGPNMSGKSALLRQTALVTLMAHCGSFVPADSARIPLTDKIFTRVGASDNLSGGESTFMVEMNETAGIINNISSRSLVLLDEIGRGTSTYDGISIAWSIAEFLHQCPEKPKTLFATHYHELNELENQFPGIKNYHITNKESGNKVIFLRKLAPGGSTHSFGIHVARMAGMPPALINRANEILQYLEEKHPAEERANPAHSVTPKMQLSIFDTHTEVFEEIRRSLQNTDINRLTPVEALLKLQEIKQRLGE